MTGIIFICITEQNQLNIAHMFQEEKWHMVPIYYLSSYSGRFTSVFIEI